MAPVASSAVQAPSWEYPPEMYAAICGQGFAWSCEKAMSVSSCEMGRKWNPNAINPASGTRGIFQIHPIHASKWPDFWTAWMNPVRNAQMAYDIWLVQGWSPWWCA